MCLVNKPDWYFRLNPVGKVPLLRYRGERLVESDLVMQFVDQFHGNPESNLLSVCGEEAFRDILSLTAEVIIFTNYLKSSFISRLTFHLFTKVNQKEIWYIDCNSIG